MKDKLPLELVNSLAVGIRQEFDEKIMDDRVLDQLSIPIFLALIMLRLDRLEDQIQALGKKVGER